ncbi:uncharacterized protein LOC141620025 [Silene latifolia]|uniref:uncharacterized protein LOC141620025 n=1 Tax=Silene latifolia TaxID=37657 RepID=UPI003D76E95A
MKVFAPGYMAGKWLGEDKGYKVKDGLNRMGVQVDPTCFLCGMADESHDHLFFDCCYSKLCVHTLQQCLRVSFPVTYLAGWFKRGHDRSKLQRKIICALHVGLVYAIWKARNKAQVDISILCPEVMIKRVMKDGINRSWARNTGRICQRDLEWLAYFPM